MAAEANGELKKEVTTPFTDASSVDRRAVHLKVDQLAMGFFDKSLNGAGN